MTTEQIRAFLEQNEIKLLIEDEELEEVYNKCDSTGRADLTEYLLSIGVQPDEYMKNIPESFLNSSKINSYDISSTVRVIGNYAFINCTSLTNITIPDSVTIIGHWAFSECSSLTSLTVGNGVTSIGGYAFNCCGELEINYNGTQKQWEAIIKKDKAFRRTSCVVHCADGDIIID